MARRNYSWTENKINKFIKEGRGQGELSQYKPWLTVDDVPSKGNRTRSKGWKTGRIHHLLSNLERDYFLLLDWTDNIIDIREQFPLDRAVTIRIAEDKGIAHPTDNRTNTSLVMTTDFLLKIKVENEITFLAKSIKPSVKLEDARVLEKLEIERSYWEEKKILWNIVTEKEIHKELTKNLQWVHSYRYLENNQEEKFADFLLRFLRRYHSSSENLNKLLVAFENEYNIDDGRAITYLRFLIANKFIKVNMTEKIGVNKLSMSNITFEKGELTNSGVSS